MLEFGIIHDAVYQHVFCIMHENRFIPFNAFFFLQCDISSHKDSFIACAILILNTLICP
jgi:hypothetical protein